MKSFYLVALAAVALPATAQEVVDVDSVAVADCEIPTFDTEEMCKTIVRPDSVLIYNGEGKMQISVYGEDGNADYFYNYEHFTADDDVETVTQGDWDLTRLIPGHHNNRKAMFCVESGGFGFGLINDANHQPGLEVDMGSSFEVFMQKLVAVRYRPARSGFSISAGVGFGMKNYRMTGSVRFVKDDSHLVLKPYPEGADPKFSRVKVGYFCLPVTLCQDLGKGFRIEGGAVVNFNVCAKMKSRYMLDGEEHTYKDDNLHQRKTTVDIFGHLKYRSIGMYVKYSPMTVLDTNFGPDFKHFSCGLTLFY